MIPWFTRSYEKSGGRASVPAVVISSRCVRRTLRKNLGLKMERQPLFHHTTGGRENQADTFFAGNCL